jgi:hypothetical protein
VGAGSPVELRDQVAGGGEHDRIQSTAAVGSPGVEEVFGECGQVADVDPLPVQVEAQCLWPSGPQRQRRGRFGGVVESVELGEPNRAMGVFDVAKDTAGTNGGQLLIITDQPNTATAANNELDGGVQEKCVRHPGLIDQDQHRGTNPVNPLWGLVIQVLEGPHEFGEGVAGRTGVVVELSSRRGGRS